MEALAYWISLVANILTIATAGIALYVFFFNREKITSAINFILNYSNQLTLTDLKFKIERLNDFNAGDTTQKGEVINILHELEGQIIGNGTLKLKLQDQLTKISTYTSNTKLLTEPRKRSLVSELKESIRNIDVANYGDIIKHNNTGKQ
jgi:hypothetical protein